MTEVNPELTLKASYDSRYNYKIHFILTDITRKFLDKHDLHVQVVDFKERVRKSKPAFYAKAGNPMYKGYRRVAVYDINNYK